MRKGRKEADAKASSLQAYKSSRPSSQADSTEKSYFVTIVTSRKYTVDSFIREAEQLGVSRAVPLRILRQIEDGEPIFVADFKSSSGKRAETNITILEDGTKIIRRGASKQGTLVIFGYFTACSEAFESSLKVIKRLREDGVINNVKQDGTSELRGCGSVAFDLSYTRKSTLKELADKLEQYKREGERVGKVFIRGPFVKLEPPIIINDVKYFRGYKRFPSPPLPDVEGGCGVEESKHIEQYHYHKNKEPAVLEQLPLQ